MTASARASFTSEPGLEGNIKMRSFQHGHDLTVAATRAARELSSGRNLIFPKFWFRPEPFKSTWPELCTCFKSITLQLNI